MSILDDAVLNFVTAITGKLTTLSDNQNVICSGDGDPFSFLNGNPYNEFPIAENAAEVVFLQNKTTQFIDASVTPINLYTLSGTWGSVVYNGQLDSIRKNTLCFSRLTNKAYFIDSGYNLQKLGYNEVPLWTGALVPEKLWYSVTYGNGLFVAVAFATSGTDVVMTSPDGINWTVRNAVDGGHWRSITYGNGLFVAVASTGNTGTQIMTSPDGINWTGRNAPVASAWSSVCYGNGLFVAVSGSGNAIMTSTNGTTWIQRTSPAANMWYSVTYGNGLFVAVSRTGTNRVMTSPDGITWTLRWPFETHLLNAVCYGNGLFVAIGTSSSTEPDSDSERVITSPDGINWTVRSTPTLTANTSPNWSSITYANGVFVAVAALGVNGTRKLILKSTDGITWEYDIAPEPNAWNSVVFGLNRFVAVATTGTQRAMVYIPNN